MAINVVVIDDDLITVITEIGKFEFSESERKVFAELNLKLLPTIDPHDITVMNELQIEPLEQEVGQLRSYGKTNENALTILEKAIKAAWYAPMHYLKFVGDK
jgi:hypothetical protein